MDTAVVECYYNGRNRWMMGYLEVGPDGWLRYRKYDGQYIVVVAECGTKREMVPA